MLQGLPPLIDARTRCVILGSFPGVASLQAQQYYGHPQNHFWKILGPLLGHADIVSATYAARCDWLLSQGIGLWDVYAACEREGSLDANIRHAVPNDFSTLRIRCPQLQVIAHNGGESFRHAKVTRSLGLPVYRLPSSSPANASWSLARKTAAWAEVLQAAGLRVTPAE